MIATSDLLQSVSPLAPVATQASATMETDQRAGKGRQAVEEEAEQSATMGLGREAREYDMSHPRRGRALLFNQSMGRQGSEQDCLALDATLAGLGFEVTVYRDSRKQEVVRLMEEVGREDHSTADCLLVAVMSHGEEGYLWDCLSHKYSPSCLWAPLRADLCPSLAGKPKMFFIQACRGQKRDQGVAVDSSAVQHLPSSITIPIHADFLFAHATVPDYVCYRDPSEGSFFIQALCDVLKKDALKDDLLSLMTKVQRVVAEKSTDDGRKQMPSVTTTLTKKIYFTNE